VGGHNSDVRKDEPKRVAGYIRVSTREQAETKLSLTNQEEKLKAYAISNDITIDRIYNDAAESAGDLNRPAMHELLAEVEKGNISHVIIYKLDRLTRNLENLGYLLRLFDKKEVSLLSVQESLNTSNASGRMIVNLLGMIAQWEREVIAERTRAALNVKRARGEKLGGIIPYGSRVAKGKGEGGKDTLVPNPKEAPVLQGILDARAEGRGYADIAQGLNQMGIKARSGGRWFPSTIRSVCIRSKANVDARGGSKGEGGSKRGNTQSGERV